MVIDFLTTWYHSCCEKIERNEANKAKRRVIDGAAVTGVSERTKLEVDGGAREFPRNCGRLRTNHGEYPFRP